MEKCRSSRMFGLTDRSDRSILELRAQMPREVTEAASDLMKSCGGAAVALSIFVLAFVLALAPAPAAAQFVCGQAGTGQCRWCLGDSREYCRLRHGCHSERPVEHRDRRFKHGERQLQHGERLPKHGERRRQHGDRRVQHGERQLQHGDRSTKHGERR